MPASDTHTEAVHNSGGKRTAWVIFIASIILYLLTNSRIHTYDGLQYALSVETGRLSQLLHPHHLLYNVVSYLLWKPLTWVFVDMRSVTVMGFLSSLSAAGGLALMYRFWRRSSVPAFLSLAGVLWLGLSYGYWSYAAEVEVYLPACFFMALALERAVLAQDRKQGRYIWQLGLAIAFMVLCTQSAVIYWLGFALWMWKERDGRWSRLLRFAIASIIPIMLIYLVSAWLVVGFSFHNIYAWLTAYSHMGQWGHWTANSSSVSLSTISTTILAIPPFITKPAVIQGVAGPLWIVWIFSGLMALLILGAFWGWSLQLRGWQGAITPLWVLLFVHFIFFTWWQPENTEFWIIFIQLLITVGVWGFSRLSRVWRNISAILLIVMGIGFGIVNYHLFIGPRTDPANDVNLKAVEQIKLVVDSEDYILLPQDKFEKTLRYWGGFANAVNLAELTTGGEHADWLQAVQSLKELQQEAEEQGRQVYMLGSIVHEGKLMQDVRNGDPMAQSLYEMLTSLATPVADVVTAEKSFELTVLNRRNKPMLTLDMLQLEWPPDTANPLEDGVGFFTNFTSKHPIQISEAGLYRINVRGKGIGYAGQGAILVLKLDDTPLGQIEFSESGWTTKSLPPMELTSGRHSLTIEYLNDLYDPSSGKGRDLFLSTIQFIPVDAKP